MIIDFQLSIKNYSDLDDINKIVRAKIKVIKKKHQVKRIGYVAGKVTTNGSDKILANLSRLNKFTKEVSDREKIFVFSAADIFSRNVYWKLNLPKPTHETQFYEFWGKVLKSGVTDVYLAPEWDNSLGAKDEFNRATKLGLKIHYL